MAERSAPIRSFMGIAAAALIIALLAVPTFAASLTPAQTSLVTRKLSGEMPDSGDVFYGFKISPDSQQVFFTANKISPEWLDLYRAPITGGGPLLLGEHISDDPYMQFEPSPDGIWVVFLSDADTPGLMQLYCVPAAGGDRVRLNADLPTNGAVFDFLISPDSRRVLYTATGETEYELYSVSIEGGTVVFLDSFQRNDSFTFRVTPDGTRVVYLVSPLHFARSYLRSIPIQGGEAAWLNSGSPEYEWVSDFQISPDGSLVVFKTEDLFSVPVDGGAPPVKINPDRVGLWGVPIYGISPDGGRVVYLADQQVDEQFELYSVAITGGEAMRLSGDLPPGGDVRGFLLSPEGERVVYDADQEADEQFALYSALLDGSQPAITLTDSLGSAWAYQFSPDGGQVVFGRFYDDHSCHLCSVPAVGGQVTVLIHNADWLACDGVINPDSQRVTFSTGVGLYSIGLDGEGLLQLNSPLPEDGWINNFLVAPDSRHTVYRADQDRLSVLELYSTFEASYVYFPLLSR